MSEFTYEKEAFGVLESYEWDNVWWEKNGDVKKSRVMYLGDSISCGIRNVWNKMEGIEWYMDNCGTSKAVDNPFIISLAIMFQKQMRRCDAILVNNGLHGWHLSTEEYAKHYKKLLCDLKEEFNNIPIILVTTTSVSNNEKRDMLVKERNKAARQIAKGLEIQVIDLYPISTSLFHKDGVHLLEEGYQLLADTIREELKQYKWN